MTTGTRTRMRRSGKPLAWHSTLTAVAIVLTLTWFVSALVLDIRPVHGESMQPTLRQGQWVLIIKPLYAMRAPQRGELAVCRFPGQSALWIKRVVGVPGDVLTAEGGCVLLNGQPLTEQYLAEPTPDFAPVKAWDHQYLLLGDHRSESFDSRDPTLGAVPKEALLGKAMCVIWPPDAWRAL